MEQARILEQVKRGEISQKDGVLILGMTDRHIRRKLKIFKRDGIEGLYKILDTCGSTKLKQYKI